MLTWLEIIRRRKMTNVVAGNLARVQTEDESEVHVIAHSFGTLLLSRSLDLAPLVLNHVILVGAILPRRFDWMGIWQRSNTRSRSFQRIRNEFGGQDDVVRMAGWLRLLTGACGHSGVRGFLPHRKRPIVIHEVESQWGPCRQRACSRLPILHNHSITTYDHSAFFLGGLHAKFFWLPVLMGYEATEYRDFRVACTRIEKLVGTLRGSELAERMNELANRNWSWCKTRNGHSLRAKLLEMFVAHGARLTKPEAEHLNDAILWTARFTYLGYVGDRPQDPWVRRSDRRDGTRRRMGSDRSVMSEVPPATVDEALAKLREQRDDAPAWTCIYLEYWRFVVAIASSHTSDIALAEDVAQNVFIRIARYCQFEKFVEEKRFRA